MKALIKPNLFVAALAVALGLSSPASALSSADNKKIESFRKQLIEKKLASKEQIEALGRIRKGEYIHRVLLNLDKGYRQAAKAVYEAKGDAKKMKAAWTTLLKNKVSSYTEAEARYRLGRAHLVAEEFEKAAVQFEKMYSSLAEYSTRLPESRLFLAYAYGKLEETDRARRVLADLIRRYPDAPERYLETAHWFLRELKGQGSGPLLELSKSMETIRRFLKKGETGFNPTQDRQRKVLKELDRLIKAMEQKKKGGECKDCKKQKPGQAKKKQGQKAGNKPSSPLQDSKLPGGNPNGGALKRDAERGQSEAWGNLKKAEREKVLQLFKERFPSQYKELLEQYYKSLSNKEKAVTDDR